MNKKLMITALSIVMGIFFILPIKVDAAVEITNLKEAVEEEIEIFGASDEYKEAVEKLSSYDLSNYKDDSKKVNIYIFRGSSCGHCFEAIDHFASIYKDEGKYFNIKTYEVWNNTDNNDLMKKVADKLGDEVSGVPYIVVGKKSWNGYASSYDDEIMNEVKSEYKKDKKDRFDAVNTKDVKKNYSSDIISVLIIILVVIGITCGIVFTRKKTSE